MEQPYITGIWQATFGIASILSGAIGYGFYHITSSFHGWRVLFLAVAGFSIIAGLVVIYFLPDTPTSARWASAEDKILLVERVRVNDQGIKQTKFDWAQGKMAFKDVYCWVLFFMTMFNTLVVGGIVSFGYWQASQTVADRTGVAEYLPKFINKPCLRF